MASKLYTVGDLHSATGIPIRTLRYWIRRKLLPKPLGKGRAAQYAGTHLVRAQVVQHLRASRLSLGAIADRIRSLTDEQLQAMLPAPTKRDPESPPVPPPLPSYPAVLWETVELMPGLVLLVRSDRLALRRVADEIYRYYGTQPAPATPVG